MNTKKVRNEQRGDYESISGSSGASLSGSARGTPIQFTIPQILDEDQEAAFLFEVLANTQAAITTARQENRHRRGDQEEVKGPQPVGQLDNQPQGVLRDDEDV